jgi:hypothetical protein
MMFPKPERKPKPICEFCRRSVAPKVAQPIGIEGRQAVAHKRCLVKVANRKGAGQNEKYSNETSLCPLNHSHGSKLESAVCSLLRARELAGEILIEQVQDHIAICGPPGHDCPQRKIYIPDFRCSYRKGRKKGLPFWVEAKGFANDRWPTNKTLWRHYGPGDLEIYVGDWRSPRLDEIIVPRGAA